MAGMLPVFSAVPVLRPLAAHRICLICKIEAATPVHDFQKALDSPETALSGVRSTTVSSLRAVA